MARQEDLRGIVDPTEMLRWVDFDRQPAGEALDGIIEWFWSVAWGIPDGRVHQQQVLNHPAGNLSIGTIDDRGVALDPAEGRLYGVFEGLSERRLVGQGWTVAARTTVGGLGVLTGRSARSIAGKQLDLSDLDGLDEATASTLVATVAELESNAERIDRVRGGLERLIQRRPAELLAEAREMTEVARLAEHDRTVRRVDDLAAAAGVSKRTLQRLFDQHVGASPSFVIRRWRIIDAVEEARRAGGDVGAWDGWATVAAGLGYADQAHLSRDFKRHLGVAPADYVARNTPAG